MSDAPHIALRTQPGITPEQARDARARAWRFVFNCYEKKAGVRHAGNEEKGPGHDLPASPILPQ